VVVVRGAVDLKRVAELRHLDRLRHSVPQRVDDADVDCLGLRTPQSELPSAD
jgi:hypothetical protein